MYDRQANSNLLAQRNLFGQRVQLFLILGYLARQLHDKALVLEALYVWQRLPEQIQPLTDIHRSTLIPSYFFQLRNFSLSNHSDFLSDSRLRTQDSYTCQDRLLNMQPIFCFIDGSVLWSIENLVGYNYVAPDRQAVHEVTVVGR